MPNTCGGGVQCKQAWARAGSAFHLQRALQASDLRQAAAAARCHEAPPHQPVDRHVEHGLQQHGLLHRPVHHHRRAAAAAAACCLAACSRARCAKQQQTAGAAYQQQLPRPHAGLQRIRGQALLRLWRGWGVIAAESRQDSSVRLKGLRNEQRGRRGLPLCTDAGKPTAWWRTNQSPARPP